MVDEKEFKLPLGGFLFPRIFQAFRMAIQPSKLTIALASLTVICLTGWIMDWSRTVIVAPHYASALPRRAAAGIAQGRGATELDIYLLADVGLKKNFIESRKDFTESKDVSRTGVFSTLWRFGTNEFHNGLYALLSWNTSGVVQSVTNGIHALAWAFQWHTIYSIAFFTVALVVLSLAGGAICRIAALQLARAETPGLMQAVRFSRRKLVSLLGAQIGPIVLIIVFGLPTILLGLVGNLPIAGPLLTGLLLPLSLVAGCAATVVLIGMIGGLSLMSPAMAYEDSDSFDAISRSFIVYRDPWRMGFYTILAVVYGAVCYLFVRLFGFLLLWTTHRFLQIGFLERNERLSAIWPEPTFANFLGPAGAMPDAWSSWLAALLIRIWILAVIGLMVSFVISFYFSANTIIYALMRKRVDGTPLEDICTSRSEAATEARPSETEPEAGVTEPAVETDGGSEQTRKTSE
jgi:hypothetical protein